jgi:hypothetical protein
MACESNNSKGRLLVVSKAPQFQCLAASLMQAERQEGKIDYRLENARHPMSKSQTSPASKMRPTAEAERKIKPLCKEENMTLIRMVQEGVFSVFENEVFYCRFTFRLLSYSCETLAALHGSLLNLPYQSLAKVPRAGQNECIVSHAIETISMLIFLERLT